MCHYNRERMDEESSREMLEYDEERIMQNGLELKESKEAKGKYNDLQVRFNEINEGLDYTQLLFSDDRDYEELKLRNKKLENDLIHSNERYLSELSKVRENFENQMKNRTSLLQNEIKELRQSQEQIDIEYNEQIDELQDVIETERNLQKNRFKDIISHFESILDRTGTFSEQLEKDFFSLKIKTTDLKNQTYDLELDLKKEFSDNLDILHRTISFANSGDKENPTGVTEDVLDTPQFKSTLKRNTN